MSDRPYCQCGNLVEKRSTLKDGSPSWNPVCRSCRGRYRYGIQKGDKCEECNFVPKVSAQLEIDHIDGDRTNNSKDNLKTLCANCHAYKSYVNKDIRFNGKNNGFFGVKHSKETLEKIKEARRLQVNRSKNELRKN